jgi:Domain of Unknown Function (DUF1080)
MKKKHVSNLVLYSSLIISVMSCNTPSVEKDDRKKDSAIISTPAASTAGPVEETLFDGTSLSGWHLFNKPGEIKNWTVQDGALVCLGAAKDAHGGDLVTDKDYENFELSWEWKVDKGSNSGVMYHVIESPNYKAPYETGPEYQIIDDVGFPDKLEPWQMAGADYAMTQANEKKKLMPVGEWNTSKIIYDKGHVEHWLNGEKIVEFERSSDDWQAKRAKGKWKDFPGYASVQKGKIALQDHGNKAYYRNITIKVL